MDIFTLDANREKHYIIEDVISLVWTDRFNTIGDFELTILDTTRNRSILESDSYLSIAASNRCMLIETYQTAVSDSGEKTLKVSGRSSVVLLDTRQAILATSYTSDYKYEVTDVLPKDFLVNLVNQICVLGTYNSADVIPFLAVPQLDAIPDSKTLAWPTDTMSESYSIQSVLSIVQSVCSSYSMGFDFTIGESSTDASAVYFNFNLYMGRDRTTTQSLNEAVIFSEALETMTNTNLLKSKKDTYNVAIVASKNAHLEVYSTTSAESATGTLRKVMYVDASDIEDSAGSALDALLKTRGLAALADVQEAYVMDGEVNNYGSRYTYLKDYDLGDIVEMRDNYGVISKMRITEQIISIDSSGIKSYPSLESYDFVTPGSWNDWRYYVDWDDAVGTWG